MQLERISQQSCLHNSTYLTLIKWISDRLTSNIITQLDNLIKLWTSTELFSFAIDFLEYCEFNPHKNSNNKSNDLDRLLTYLLTKKSDKKSMELIFHMVNLIYTWEIKWRDNLFHPQEDKVFYFLLTDKSLKLCLINIDTIENMNEWDIQFDEFLLECWDIEVLYEQPLS